ncbi:ketosteroid isomerase-like protein [Algoriphagus sp. 4150]|uniref:Atu4866 domain-containing protein n=1 Tax=Algoriphagus sp. 4150 TaxID=2817756 RepID=UPI002855E6E8|nr:Atu4866 domain-containing protein [Algoriphagus sp. 4150]MDR7129728.1 ketosteroid isomerase-like protein [Algoriphagus sp. 4150]
MKIIYAILSLGILFLFHAVSAQGNFGTEENKEAVVKAFGQWQQGKGSLFDLLDEHVEWRVSGNGSFSGTYKGKQHFMEKAVIPINDRLATEITPELIDINADGNTVWLHWQGTATAKNGAVYHNEYAWKLEFNKGKIVKAVAFLDIQALDNLSTTNSSTMQPTIESTKEYIGMWVTKDGYIRHELLPNNRYDEARGNRKSAYQGSYKVSGNHIDYVDDTGFTADGEFKDGILYHAGMILYKEK